MPGRGKWKWWELLNLEEIANWFMKAFVTALLTVGVHFAGSISVSIHELNDKMAKVMQHAEVQDREYKVTDARLTMIEKRLGMRRR